MKNLSSIDKMFYKHWDVIEPKVCARRNYVIVLYDNKILFAGGWGQADELGFLSWYLWEIGQHNIRMWEYTYKRDFDASKKILEKIIKEWENGA